MSILREKLNSNRELGFTLIETLVSLVLLSMAIIPALMLSTEAVNIAFDVRDTLTASGLAQEGVEVVRAIRDTNWFNDRVFDTGLADGTYRVEWNSTSLLPLSGNPALNLSNGLYTYSGGAGTVFSRAITITKVNAGELRVVSRVSWTDRGVTKNVEAEEHLFNWK